MRRAGTFTFEETDPGRWKIRYYFDNKLMIGFVHYGSIGNINSKEIRQEVAKAIWRWRKCK